MPYILRTHLTAFRKRYNKEGEKDWDKIDYSSGPEDIVDHEWRQKNNNTLLAKHCYKAWESKAAYSTHDPEHDIQQSYWKKKNRREKKLHFNEAHRKIKHRQLKRTRMCYDGCGCTCFSFTWVKRGVTGGSKYLRKTQYKTQSLLIQSALMWKWWLFGGKRAIRDGEETFPQNSRSWIVKKKRKERERKH